MTTPECFIWRTGAPDGAPSLEELARAVEQAGLRPVSGDAPTGQWPLWEYVVADVTHAGAAELFELGKRAAVRPSATVLLCAEPATSAGAMDAIPYRVTPQGATFDAGEITRRLLDARASRSSSLFHLVEDFSGVAHTKTDVFRDLVRYSPDAKSQLADARKKGADAVRQFDAALGDLRLADPAVIIDLMLSYRAVKAWDGVIDLVNRMPGPLAGSLMVREQLAFALNRAGRGEEAEQILRDLIAAHGPSSETSALLGRVYKDRWEAAAQRSDPSAPRILDQAIEAYLEGFQADSRDTLPGINVVTLMELRDPPDLRKGGLLPIVTYAVDRKIATGKADYWDFATRIELAVLATDEAAAEAALAKAIPLIREPWEPETTLRNLRLIREKRAARGEAAAWAESIEARLRTTVP